MSARLYIARHGNTFDPGEAVLRVGGRTDLPLSASGRAQAQALAQHFEGVRFDRIYAAPLKRAMETAQAIAAVQGARPAPLTSLTEIDYGPDEGQPEAAVLARIGATALEAWETHATPPPGWAVDTLALIAAWRALFVDAATRSCTLAVTSNGVARFALDAAGAAGFPRKLRTGAYGVVEIEPDGRARVLSWDIRP